MIIKVLTDRVYYEEKRRFTQVAYLRREGQIFIKNTQISNIDPFVLGAIITFPISISGSLCELVTLLDDDEDQRKKQPRSCNR